MQGSSKLLSDFNMIKLKDRLTTAMLLQMAVRLTLVVIVVTSATYWHVSTTYENQVIETLEKYIQERGDKESAIFELAESNHQVFKNTFIEAWQSSINVLPAQYNRIFEQQSDGTTRIRSDLYYGVTSDVGYQQKYISGYIGVDAPVNEPSFKNRLNIAYHLLNKYGPAWTNKFENLYVSMPENVALLYWPDLPWGLNASSDLDTSKEIWVYIANKENNPQREPVWTELYFDRTAKDWMISLETPVDIDGQHLLNIGHDILFADVIDRIINDKLEGTYNFIISQDGQVIVHPDLVKTTKQRVKPQSEDLKNSPELNNMIKEVTSSALANKQESSIIFDELEQSWLAYTRIKGPEWLLVTVYPQALVTTAARSTAHFILIIGLVSLIVELLMLYVVTRDKVVEPLRMFGRASAEIGKANYQVVASGELALPGNRKDEVGMLANVFKSMAVRIIDYSTTLEEKVIARTKQLEESRRKAEIASKAKSDFLAHMSHEVRTPMNAIIGLSQLMLKTKIDKRQRDFMEKILSSSDVLLNTINDVLDYSKIEANKLSLENIHFDIRDVLRRITNIIAYKAQCKGVELLLDIDEKLPFHWVGDPTRLGQILLNLATNAVKFTDTGEVIIRLKIQDCNDEQYTLHFTVTDTGIGIDESRIDHLFSPFVQADSSVTRKYGGTGLGLAICRQLTELMGGDIWVDSQPQWGSEFHFTCKLTASENNEQQWPSYNKLKGMRALVVDDNDMAREVLEDILVTLGLDVCKTADGYSALAELESASEKNESYDIVFIDWNIPKLNGIETAKLIAKNTKINQPVAMLLVTACDVDKIDYENKDVNIKKVMSKPVDASGIHDSLVEIFFNEGARSYVPKVQGINLSNNIDMSVLKNSKILVVDDSPLNREVANEFLTDVGVNVTNAGNGREAIDLLMKEDFDLILMDVQMPIMDGLTATKIIREKSKYKQLPIIAMTAHASQDDYKRSLDVGMNDHLNKPIDHQLLYRTVARWIDSTSIIIQYDPDDQAVSNSNTLPLYIECFNTLVGMKNHGNKESLYKRMLCLFLQEYQIFSEFDIAKSQLVKISQDKDNSSLNRFFHTMKSSAANLGQSKLSALAKELENTIEDNAVVLNNIDPFVEQLNLTLTALSGMSWLKEKKAKPIASRNDNKHIRVLIKQLNQMLEEDNATAVSLIAKLKDTSIIETHHQILESIEHQIHDVDYHKAQTTLKTLTDNMQA